jgi:hypothetical protein
VIRNTTTPVDGQQGHASAIDELPESGERGDAVTEHPARSPDLEELCLGYS